MAEAERIIGTPDVEGAGPEQPSGAEGAAAAAGGTAEAGSPAAGKTAGSGAAGQPDGRPAAGSTGSAGAAGSTGSAGAAGSTGAAMPTGSTGAAMPTGSTGSTADGGAEAGAEPVDGAVAAPPAGQGRRMLAVLFVVALVAYALDLGSKLLVVAKLEPSGETVSLIGELLQLRAIRNAGAAFGIGEAYTIVFTIIAASVIVVIARLARKLYSMPWAIALGLLLGGALGNLTDRIFRSPGFLEGAVVDFIAPARFAVFNLADSAVVCGGILIVILSFRGLDPDGTVHKS